MSRFVSVVLAAGTLVLGGTTAIPPAVAEPSLHATLNARCTPTALDLTLNPGSIVHFTMYVSGHEAPVHRYTLETTIRASDGGALPDAWRFDPDGCQPANSYELSSIFIVDPVQVCPFLAFIPVLPYQRTNTYDPDTGSLRLTLTTTYNQEMPPRDPARSYLVGRFFTDHSLSVPGVTTEAGTCGGVDRGVCIAIGGTWTDLQGGEHTWDAATPFVTVNTGGTSCDPVPVRDVTWGLIKAQYR